MSFILDALKKSDRERQQEEAPSQLQSLHGTPPSFKGMSVARRRRLPWLLFSGLLVLGGLFTWYGWNRQEPEGQAFPSLKLAAPETSKPLSPVNIHPEKFDDWNQQLHKRDRSLPSQANPQPEEMAANAADPDASPPTAANRATRGKNIFRPIKIKRDHEKIILSTQAKTTVIDQPSPVPPVPAKKAESTLPYLQDLPPQLRAEIPKLQFAGHAYALAPSQRMIIINGSIMREGDRLDAVTRLAEITWDGVIIDSGGVLFQVRCH